MSLRSGFRRISAKVRESIISRVHHRRANTTRRNRDGIQRRQVAHMAVCCIDDDTAGTAYVQDRLRLTAFSGDDRSVVAAELPRTGAFTAGPNPQAAAARTGRGLADLLLGISRQLPAAATRTPRASLLCGVFPGRMEDPSEGDVDPGYPIFSLELPRTEDGDKYVFLDLESGSPLDPQVPRLPDLRGGVGFVGVSGAGRRTQLADRNNWDPRIGIAWELNPLTVVRTGFGVFTSSIAPNTDASLGFQRTTSNSLAAQPDGVTPLFNLSNPLPSGFLPVTGNQLGLLTNVGQGISGPLRQQRLPYQVQWSFDLQRQLPWSTVVEVGYAGSAGVALPSAVQYNQLPSQFLSLGTQLNETVPNPFFGVITDPTSTLSRSTVQRGQLLRPYPQFTGAAANQAPVGHSTYHAMQMRVERRFSDGLAVLFAWTHSKLMDNVGDFGGFLGAGGFNNNNCFPCDRSLSYYDIPDIVRLSLRYELPFGVGKPRLNHGALARIAGGWSSAMFFTWDNGTPVQVVNPNDSNSLVGVSGPTRPESRLDSRTANSKTGRLESIRTHFGARRSLRSATLAATCPMFAFLGTKTSTS